MFPAGRGGRVVAGVALIVAGAVALLFFGGQVRMCLGPLGVTAVQCARVTGVVPEVGPGLPLLALAVSVAVFMLAPVPGGRRSAVLAGWILGAALGAVAFLALRPLTMEGPDSSGAWISIPRPLDGAALLTAVIVAGLAASIAARLATGHLARRAARS